MCTFRQTRTYACTRTRHTHQSFHVSQQSTTINTSPINTDKHKHTCSLHARAQTDQHELTHVTHSQRADVAGWLCDIRFFNTSDGTCWLISFCHFPSRLLSPLFPPLSSLSLSPSLSGLLFVPLFLVAPSSFIMLCFRV